jgi:hypothetical protein
VSLLLALLLLLLAPPAWALQPIYADQYGAMPDGAVRTDCSITSRSDVLACTAGTFAPTDVGKVIAIYGAGPLTGGYRQPFTTTIASRQSPTEVILAGNASTTANPSPRVVYGHDNTAILQRIIDTTVGAPDGRGGNVGGTLQLGPGTYLVKSLKLPCSAIGVFPGAGTCTRAYNHIAIRGAGRIATTLENWDMTATTAVIAVGGLANEPDGSAANPMLAGFELSDLTVRQVLNATDTGTKTINGQALIDARFERVTVTGSSYECLYVWGRRITVRDNYASGCGAGGPGRGIALSAYNILSCTDCNVAGERLRSGARRG